MLIFQTWQNRSGLKLHWCVSCSAIEPQAGAAQRCFFYCYCVLLRPCNFAPGFSAVQNSSIDDLVTHWLTQWLLILTLQSDPRDLRHLIRVMGRHDLTEKDLQGAFSENLKICDICDTDYSTDHWEPGLMTILVTWQLIVTLDSICNSCDVLYVITFFRCYHIF